MKIFTVILLFSILLSGCTYSSANMIRAQGKDVMVFGAWGYVHCQDSTITLYTGRACTTMKKENYTRMPAMPDIKETKEYIDIEHK